MNEKSKAHIQKFFVEWGEIGITVDSIAPGVEVPDGYANELGEITLKLSRRFSGPTSFGEEAIHVTLHFRNEGWVAVVIPWDAILAIHTSTSSAAPAVHEKPQLTLVR